MIRKYPKYRTRVYTICKYDVVSDGHGGFEVNDVHSHGTVEIRCKLEVFNEGTKREFVTWDPTDRQCSKAVDGKRLSWDGEATSYTLYAKDARTGKPAGELRFERFVDGRDENNNVKQQTATA